jgi:hypothetical protein
MPSILTTLVIVLVAVVNASLAQACPLNRQSGTYTEVAVPCAGSQPDFSQIVAINQANPLPAGGECRIEAQFGKSFYVKGQNLIMVNAQNEIEVVGVLMNTPSCYQTDSGGEFYSSWSQVRF